MSDLGKDIIDQQNGFVKMSYLIDQSGGWGGGWGGDKLPKMVQGYAFETPGWLEFHACVRWDSHLPWWDKEWIVDHYESGMHVSSVGKLERKEDAPAALAKVLNKKGRERVESALRKSVIATPQRRKERNHDQAVAESAIPCEIRHDQQGRHQTR